MAFYRPASYQKPLAIVLLLGCLALPSVLTAFGQEFYVGFASRVLIFALAASSLNLVLGFGGMFSLGHAAFFGAGAYAAAICMKRYHRRPARLSHRHARRRAARGAGWRPQPE